MSDSVKGDSESLCLHGNHKLLYKKSRAERWGMMKEKKLVKTGQLKGSYTVEASLIVPLLIMVVILLIYAVFYLYDVACIWQGSYLAALRAEIEGGELACKQQRAEETCTDYFRQELWALQNPQYQVNIDRGRIVTSMQAKMRVPVGGRIFHSLWQIEAAGEVKRIRPVAFIRTCNKAKSMMDWIEKGAVR